MLNKVVIACTGSVAIFAIPNLILTMRRAYNAEIALILSTNALQFVTPFGMSSMAGSKALCGNDEPIGEEALCAHLHGAAAFLIAPATANTIAQIASGQSDSLIARAAMLFTGPLLVAPAMNSRMWENPSTQSNVSNLRAMGITIIGPGEGLELATFQHSGTALASIDLMVTKLLEVI